MSVRSDWTRAAISRAWRASHARWMRWAPRRSLFLRTGEVLALPDIRALAGRRRRSHCRLGKGRRARADHGPAACGTASSGRFSTSTTQAAELAALRSGDGADVAGADLGGRGNAQAEKSLRDSEDHYRHTVELNPQITWDRAAPTGGWTGWPSASRSGPAAAASATAGPKRIHPKTAAELRCVEPQRYERRGL
jgi:hypothetical protein